jgi:hypothetical protein
VCLQLRFLAIDVLLFYVFVFAGICLLECTCNSIVAYRPVAKRWLCKQPIGLWDVEAPTFSRQSSHKWRRSCLTFGPAGRPLPQHNKTVSYHNKTIGNNQTSSLFLSPSAPFTNIEAETIVRTWMSQRSMRGESDICNPASLSQQRENVLVLQDIPWLVAWTRTLCLTHLLHSYIIYTEGPLYPQNNMTMRYSFSLMFLNGVLGT